MLLTPFFAASLAAIFKAVAVFVETSGAEATAAATGCKVALSYFCKLKKKSYEFLIIMN